MLSSLMTCCPRSYPAFHCDWWRQGQGSWSFAEEGSASSGSASEPGWKLCLPLHSGRQR